MKNNTKLAIVFTLAAALMSSAAMAVEAGVSNTAGGPAFEADPGRFDGKLDYVLYPLASGMNSRVDGQNGRILTLEQVLENFPHFRIDLLADVPARPRDFSAGEALVGIIMARNAFPARIGPEVAAGTGGWMDGRVDWGSPNNPVLYTEYDKAAEPPVGPPTMFGFDRTRRDGLISNTRREIIQLASFAPTGNDARVGDNTFFYPTGRELGLVQDFGPSSAELYALLKSGTLSESEYGSVKEQYLKALEFEEILEEKLEAKMKIDPVDFTGEQLLAQINATKFDLKGFLADKDIHHFFAEFNKEQQAGFVKLGEELAAGVQAGKLSLDGAVNKLGGTMLGSLEAKNQFEKAEYEALIAAAKEAFIKFGDAIKEEDAKVADLKAP